MQKEACVCGQRLAFTCKQFKAYLWEPSSRRVRTASCLKGSDSGRKSRKPCYLVNCQDFLCMRSSGALLRLYAIETRHHLAWSICKVHRCNKCHPAGVWTGCCPAALLVQSCVPRTLLIQVKGKWMGQKRPAALNLVLLRADLTCHGACWGLHLLFRQNECSLCWFQSMNVQVYGYVLLRSFAREVAIYICSGTNYIPADKTCFPERLPRRRTHGESVFFNLHLCFSHLLPHCFKNLQIT